MGLLAQPCHGPCASPGSAVRPCSVWSLLQMTILTCISQRETARGVSATLVPLMTARPLCQPSTSEATRKTAVRVPQRPPRKTRADAGYGHDRHNFLAGNAGAGHPLKPLQRQQTSLPPRPPRKTATNTTGTPTSSLPQDDFTEQAWSRIRSLIFSGDVASAKTVYAQVPVPRS